ncbi:MAG: glycosyltransferase family 9 protein [Gemmatimonadetes bacterium]|nr:glycosyltransferase family 9 protein [Gemmatimonadota bacterium]
MDLVVRAPNHLGDLVLALPALRSAAGDVVVVEPLASLAAMGLATTRVIPLARGPRGFLRVARELRASGYRRGVLLTRAFSAALLFRVGGVAQLRGTATDGRSFLLEEALDPARLRGRHRALQYLELTGALPHANTRWPGDPSALPHANVRSRGDARAALLEAGDSPLLVPPAADVNAWRERLSVGGRPLVGIAPGSKATSRRWPAERFEALVERLLALGVGVAVFGGPHECALTARVSGGPARAPRAADLGGQIDLRALAAGFRACDLVVANDSGPMHLAAAVGTPTLSLWGAGDPVETAPLGSGHRRLVHAELSCVPCVKNECPRSGAGEILAQAERECLALITVEDAMEAVAAMLARSTLALQPRGGRKGNREL